MIKIIYIKYNHCSLPWGLIFLFSQHSVGAVVLQGGYRMNFPPSTLACLLVSLFILCTYVYVCV